MTDKDTSAPTNTVEPAGQYRVLARKYRPSTFKEMIGQEAMVRVLTNAISSGRLAHAFMLTGVRGVGKTTTARVLARGFNCSGPNDNPDYGPTIEPCGVCEHCRAIAEDRHVDVLEMDAASRTGVDDIRELIESMRYRPTSARYKVYIIDEVHMLSKNAFNALLKTLEEPPEHVKFIFATTEIRKVPVTVLSRCQRFDLRRVDTELLTPYFSGLVDKEGASMEANAVEIIARVADGSVRDGLSLLDQAISNAEQIVTEQDVRDMLGLVDRSQSFDLFEATMKGDAATALEIFSTQYQAGADPVQVVEDLLDVTHWLTRIKVSPDVLKDVTVAEVERVRGQALSEGVGMPGITRAWQILLKGLSEVLNAPSDVQAAEMVLVRLAHASTLPSPEEALKSLNDEATADQGSPPPSAGTSGARVGGSGLGAMAVASQQSPVLNGAGGGGGGPRAALSVIADTGAETDEALPQVVAETVAAPAVESETQLRQFASLREIADRAGEKREGRLQAFLINNARLVRLKPGHLEVNGGAFADEVTLRRLRTFLEEETGRGWAVVNSRDVGEDTLAEVEAQQTREVIREATEHPLVKAVLETFPGAKVTEIEKHTPGETPFAEEVGENNDPDQEATGDD